MKRKLVNHLIVVLALIVFLGAGLTAVAKKKPSGGPSYLATLEINDHFSGTLLLSDLNGTYVDSRLDEGDPCVQAWVKEKGFFFIYTNRSSEQGYECQQYVDETLWRWYVLSLGTVGGIEFGEKRAHRIRAEGLFSKNAQETSISFMFHYLGESYTLDTAGDISGTGNTRTLTSLARYAQLWKFPPKGTNPKGKEKRVKVGDPFVFPFELTVTRVAQ